MSDDFFTRLRRMVYSTPEEEAEEQRERERVAETGISGGRAMADSGGRETEVTQVNHPNAPEGQTNRRGRFVPTEEFDERGESILSSVASYLPTPSAGGFFDQAQTALEGYGDTTTLGARPYLTAAVGPGDVEDVRRESDQRMMRNPLSYMGGAAAGIVPSALATRGQGAPAAIANVSRAAPAVGGRAGQLLTRLGQMAGPAARGMFDPVGTAARSGARGARAVRAGRTGRRSAAPLSPSSTAVSAPPAGMPSLPGTPTLVTRVAPAGSRTAGQRAVDAGRRLMASPGAAGTVARAVPVAATTYLTGQAEGAIQAGLTSNDPVGSPEFWDDVTSALEFGNYTLGPLAAVGGLRRGAQQGRRLRTGNTETQQQVAEAASRNRRETAAFLASAGANPKQIENLTATTRNQPLTRGDQIFMRLNQTDPNLVTARQSTDNLRRGIEQAATQASDSTQQILNSVPARQRNALDNVSAQLAGGNVDLAGTLMNSQQVADMLRTQGRFGQQAVQRAADTIADEVANVSDYNSLRSTINGINRRAGRFAREGKFNEAEEVGMMADRLVADHLLNIENQLLQRVVGDEINQALRTSRQRTTDLLNLESFVRTQFEPGAGFLQMRFFLLGTGGGVGLMTAGEWLEEQSGLPGTETAVTYGGGLAAVAGLMSLSRNAPQYNRRMVAARNRLEEAHPDVLRATQRALNQVTANSPFEAAIERQRIATDALGLIVERERAGEAEPALRDAVEILDFEGFEPVEAEEDNFNQAEEITDFDF